MCKKRSRGGKVALLLFFVLTAMLNTVSAQRLNNEWIVNGKTYFKFKIPTDGLYRITGSNLATAGLSGATGNNLQLWHNGVQVPIYVSKAGALASSDYIEFWGEHNDGSVDTALFKKAADQLNRAKSFEGDSATYFLTTNATVNQNLRITDAENTAATDAAGMTAEPYFYYTIQNELGTTFNAGAATAYGSEYVYMSDYKGKCFGIVLNGSKSTTTTFSNLYGYTGDASLTGEVAVGIAGASNQGNNRSITLKGADGVNTITPLGNFESKIIKVVGAEVGSSYKVTITNGSTNTADLVNASFVELHYPRTFNFGGATSFGFDLGASSSARFLNITNFAANGSTPILYNLTSGKRYTAVKVGSNYQFVLPAMDSSHLALVGQASNSYTSIGSTAITERSFPDFTSSDQQGDYLIISNKALYGNGNYVAQYASYRKSPEGGNYNVHIYNIDDLEDMFAFGVHSSPLSIINFLKYARQHFSISPKFVFLIGRGLSFNNLQGANESDPLYQAQNLIPTFGWPASDVMLASENKEPIAATAIGRLSAVKPEEIQNYLDKVKVYEAAQKKDDNTVENNAWKKNVVFISGGGNQSEDALFNTYLDGYKNIMNDGFYGANSYNLRKIPTDVYSNNTSLKEYIDQGLGMINYFGHGASTTIGYGELSDPSIYEFNNRYPIVLTSGCDVGDCYSFMAGRMSTINNIVERYIFGKNVGSVGFVAETYLGVTSFLDNYNKTLFRELTLSNYGLPITKSMQVSQMSIIAPDRIKNTDSLTNFAHAEQTNFFGDPAIAINSFAKPDFAVELDDLILPKSVSIADGKFHLKAYLYNLGRAAGKTIHIRINQKRADGSIVSLYNNNLPSIRSVDSLSLDVEIDANKDVGDNQIIISLDDDNQYEELSETNNSITKNIYIYANGITPVYPYKYSIIRNANASLVASTSDALAAEGNYVMELDTTQLFNSSSLITKTIKSIGGAISFDPGISYRDSAVYYWRVSPVPGTGEDYRWANSSFQYITISGNEKQDGIGQSHVGQHILSYLEGIGIDSLDRKWKFGDRNVDIYMAHAVQQGSLGTSSFVVQLYGKSVSSYYCPSVGNSIMFNVFSPDGIKPYINQTTPSPLQTVSDANIGGFMGSVSACKASPYSYDVDPVKYQANKGNFQFSFQTKANRDNIAKFMDWLPEGAYVLARIFVVKPFGNVPLIDDWKSDGSGSSLYDKFIAQGLNLINDFTVPQGALFLFKKGDKGLVPIQRMTGDINGQILLTETLNGKDSIGYVTSPKFGPAKAWSSIQWNGNSEEATSTDHASVDVIGITASGSTAVLRTLSSTEQNVDISSIDATTYPYLQLKLRNVDSVNYTPYQLRYWHIMYTPVPEGALAGNLGLQMQDTLNLGDDYHFAIAFQNVSDQIYSDSIKATVTVKDTSNNVFTIPVSRLKPLVPGDTAMLAFTIPGYYAIYNKDNPTFSPLSVGTSNLAGGNMLSVSLNPDNNPLEQTLENNSLAQRFFVKSSSVPVDFGKFSASLMPDYTVHLSWHVLTAINSDYYIIQRSTDGKTFKEISRKNSLGDGTNDVTYSALDDITSLSGQPTTVFYRIVGVDKAAHSYYSSIASVHPIWDNWSFSIAPNPITQDKLQILLTSKETTTVKLKLMDMTGRVLLQQNLTPDSDGKILVNTPRLTAGIYLVQVIQGNHKAAAKVIRK